MTERRTSGAEAFAGGERQAQNLPIVGGPFTKLDGHGRSGQRLEDREESRFADRLPVGDVEGLHSGFSGIDAAVLECAREDPQVGNAHRQVQEAETRHEAPKKPRAVETRNDRAAGPGTKDEIDPHGGAVEDEQGVSEDLEKAPHLRGF